MLHYKNQYSALLYLFFILIFFTFSACSSIPRDRKLDDFIIVHTQAGDSPDRLAMQYLNDPSQGWQIRGFNQMDSLEPGQDIAIPLKPFNPGGMTPAGYQTIPVLSYKGFSTKKSSKGSVSKGLFEEQMEYLQKNNYRVISLNQFLGFLQLNTQIHDQSVLLIIDSIDTGVYDIAFPILQKYQLPAAIFITPDQIGKKNTISWEQISRMSANRIDIQCKLKNEIYPFPSNETFYRYFQTVKTEIEHATQLVNTKIHKPCGFFLYPAGKYNSLLINILKKQGFHGAFTDQPGKNPFFIDPYKIHYTDVSKNDDIPKFKSLLETFQTIELK